ncbi:sensor histidine kinase, partial [Mycobacterium sp. ITM-2017-0098]
MPAVTDTDAVTDRVPVDMPEPADTVAPPPRAISATASASLLTGGALAMVWFWIPLAILVIGISSIPSVIGFLLAGVVFVYLMRGVD